VLPAGLARMRHRENRRDREFMLGNSRTKLPDTMHAREFDGNAPPVSLIHTKRLLQHLPQETA